MSVSEFDNLWTDTKGNENADSHVDNFGNVRPPPTVTYTPHNTQLDFGQLPPYTAEQPVPQTSHANIPVIQKKSKRTKWIAVTVIIVAVCVVIAVLGSVFIVNLRSAPTKQDLGDYPQYGAHYGATCDAKPCQHGATCIDGAGYVHCHCPGGFTGSACETDINQCSSGPCANNGSCIDGVNKYSCQCASGFSGANCEEDINECEDILCANGGTCLDGINGYTCECEPGFNGSQCEVVVRKALTTCPDQFVHHRDSGRCYLIQEDPNQQLKWSEAEAYCQLKGASLASLETEEEKRYVASQFTWQRKDHFIGARRAEMYSLMYWNSGAYLPSGDPLWWEGEPKISRMCVTLVYRRSRTYLYSRDCDLIRPFVCERADIHPSDSGLCSSSPCYNGGTCRNLTDAHMYVCECEPGYTGKQCESGPFYNCPESWILYQPQRRCYLIKDDSAEQQSWNNAHELCEMRQGSLASLETAGEVQFIGSHLSWEGRYHMLSGRKESDGQYYWSTGQVISPDHSEWAHDEPKATRDCVSAAINSDNITRLYSVACDSPRPFICERPIL